MKDTFNELKIFFHENEVTWINMNTLLHLHRLNINTFVTDLTQKSKTGYTEWYSIIINKKLANMNQSDTKICSLLVYSYANNYFIQQSTELFLECVFFFFLKI